MSVFQHLRRAIRTKGPKSHGIGFQSEHTPVHSTRLFRHVPVIQKHYRDDPQLRKGHNTLCIDRDINELEGDLLAIKMRLKGRGYRDSDVLRQLEDMYGASRESLWALNDTKRKLNEEMEQRKSEDLEKELCYYRGWGKRRKASDYAT
ncbi:hypothetical protein FGADI_3444 [Fusarium gaditjirri]|uniref:Uncharacterized protein n=1 Tax=Fusarium gaditjirri TaxID=282569 RepID=A0A8H4TFK4_9HYPO|nr:hypothetical protein FGADI_3444 [Fusarium gaditjirri]